MSFDYAAALDDLLRRASALGATSADALLSRATSVAVRRRLARPESVTRSEDGEVGLRVFVGARQAIVSSCDLSPAGLALMAERGVAMARAVPEDPFAGIADPDQICTSWTPIDLFDPTELGVEAMSDLADRAEQAALGTPGITNSDGAECGYGSDETWYAATNGFMGGYASSGFYVSVEAIAGEGTEMETDYFSDSAAYLADLMNPEEIGREAARRAVRALNPRKGPTRRVPVVFDWRVAGGMIGSLASAASGGAVARGTTLLKDKMGQRIFAPGVTIVDDPFLARGPRSRPFDGEGLAPVRRAVVEDGVLTGWFLDLASARQLKTVSTGNASRGVSAPPSPRPSNLSFLPGLQSPQDLIAEIEDGFFVTSLMGSGGNIVTGDYSRGAAGFWIEKGKIAYPVSGMTIAGNLQDMWMNLTPGSDLKIRSGIDAPTLRIDGMTVAGA